jgi:transposase
VINLEESKVIQILYKQGFSKKAIAKKLGISINTVRKYIKTGIDPAYKARSTKPGKLDPYKSYINKRLKDAKPHWVPAAVIYREITVFGYTGCSSILRAYMHELKPKADEPIIRFETAPGQQMQVDWAIFRRGKDRLSAFIATLGYSRACYVEFVSDEKLDTLISCHQHAFEYFGGIPYTILYDNMKTVVIERNSYGPGKHRFQSGFWDYAKHVGFCPKVCQPYRAQTKGKVERFIHYLKHSFYFPLIGQLNGLGLTLDKDTANVYVLKWLNEVANKRLHATTQAIPFERLLEEQKILQPIGNQYVGQLCSSTALNENKIYSNTEDFDALSLQHELIIYQRLLEQSWVAA